MQRLQPTQEKGREVVIAPGLGRPVLLLVDRDVTRPVEQPVQRHLALGACKRRARTRVDPESERDVLARVGAVDVELVGVLERAWIPVAGTRREHQ